MDVITNTDGLSTLIAALEAAGIDLSSGEFTVFAPTDEAFATTLESLEVSEEDFLADTETLSAIVNYHLVEGIMRAEDIAEVDENIATLNGASITVNASDDSVILTDSDGNVVNVVQPDIEASNGVIHIIEGVLMPPIARLISADDLELPYTFDYPDDFEANVGLNTDLVTLTRGDQKIVVVGPESYTNVFGGRDFESDAEELAFYLDRTGYDIGEETTTDTGIASTSIAFPRAGQVGVATLIDLENNRRGVVIALGADEGSLPDDVVATIIESIVYPPDIMDVASNTDGFTALVAAVEATGVDLRSGEVTVFAPTDEAFAAALETLGLTQDELLEDTETLSAILNYHVVDGLILAEDIAGMDGEEVETLNGAVVTVGASDDAVTLTDSGGNVVNIIETDIEASNGVIHVIDAVLLPPLEAAEPEPTETVDATMTVLELAITNPDLSTLASLVVSGGLFGDLNDTSASLTVFAPTNEAFAAALEALEINQSDLEGNPTLLTSILTYHVVDSAVLSGDIEDGQALATRNGATLTVGVSDDGVTLTDEQGNTYTVVTADMVASNGVIHVIDGVLLPGDE